MPGGIDYSKWDRMNFSDDDDDEQDDTRNGAGPRVTRLDRPSRVTVSKTGEISVTGEATAQQSPTSIMSKSPVTSSSTSVSKSDAKQSSSDPALPSGWTEKGGSTRFGGTDIVWTQDRESVTMRFLIADKRSTKGWNVQVTGMLKYADRKAGVATSTKPHLEIRQQDCVFIQASLPHPIHGSQDDDDDADEVANGAKSVDWTIERSKNDRAYIAVSFFKAAPMDGVAVWWSRPLEGADDIDMEWRTGSTAASNFQQAWEEAHKQFRQKMAEKNG